MLSNEAKMLVYPQESFSNTGVACRAAGVLSSLPAGDRRTILPAVSAPLGPPEQGGDTVPTVIAHHDVKDTKHWLASPKREEVFGPLGITNIRTFVNPEDPTRVAVLMDVADMDVLNAAMQGKPVADAMAYDGVLPETVVVLVEA
jgi:hypothetical protein